jgi:hypothetical protein
MLGGAVGVWRGTEDKEKAVDRAKEEDERGGKELVNKERRLKRIGHGCGFTESFAVNFRLIEEVVSWKASSQVGENKPSEPASIISRSDYS